MSGLIVDSFAGGGGASLGIERALGRSPDIAINHDLDAIRMHQVNHPGTRHISRNIWQVDPFEEVGRQPVDLLWASPDCKHFSKAKGGRPAKRNIRDLAWVVVLWAKRARPRVICLENVEEFRDWGPLTPDGRPCPERKGETFLRWVGELRRLGYRVEWRELRACDYGAPTIRRRLFLVARRDGRPIRWPEPTHGPGLLPYRTAAECIDWSVPCPSIFGRKRPLAEATQRRIARGLVKYVLQAARPFLVPVTHQGDLRVHALDEPLRTITTAQRGEQALVSPYFVRTDMQSAAARNGVHAPAEPLRTITTGGGLGVVAPIIAGLAHGEHAERAGTRCHGLDEPVRTIHAGGGNHALVAAWLAQHNTGMTGHDMREAVSTIVGRGCTQALCAAFISRQFGTSTGSPADAPLGTVMTQGGGKSALVAAFLQAYYGTGDGQQPDDPMRTVSTRDRFGLVTVTIDGAEYVVTDIGMRMLSPRELFRAQGFPDSYVIDQDAEGRPFTKTAQIKACGNSVCPQVAEAIIRANLAEIAAEPREVAA